MNDRAQALEDARQAVEKALSYGPVSMRRDEAGEIAATAINALRAAGAAPSGQAMSGSRPAGPPESEE